jgi:hypothetical protein
MTTELVEGFDQGPSGLAELDHASLQITKWTFYETVRLLVMGKKMVPKGMLSKSSFKFECN